MQGRGEGSGPARATDDESLSFGAFRFDLRDRTLSRDDTEVALPPRALVVLEHLLDRPREIVPKEDLLAAAWPDSVVSEQSLSEAIRVLRQALGDDPKDPTYIQTIHRRGYRLMEGVSRKPGRVAGPTAGGPVANGAAPPGTTRPASRIEARFRRVRSTTWILLLAVSAAIGVGALWNLVLPSPLPPSGPERFVLPTKELVLSQGASSLAISPDGRHVVYAAHREDGLGHQLFVREMGTLETRPIVGTEGGLGPFFSPDGNWLGFFAHREMRKIAVGAGFDGGTPVTICDTPDPRGASWGPDDNIVFTPAPGEGLWVVAADGGEPRNLTRPDVTAGEITHSFPEFLPGGRTLLFTVGFADTASFDDAAIAVLSLDTGEREVVIEGGTFPKYLSAGYLAFSKSYSVLVVPFDPRAAELLGSPVPVLDGVQVNPIKGEAQFAVSDTGSLIYARGHDQSGGRDLVWVDRRGAVRPLSFPARRYVGPMVSPDGTRIAVMIGYDIWVLELDTGRSSRLTAEEGIDWAPIWASDSRRVIYTSSASEHYSLNWKSVEGFGEPALLLRDDISVMANSSSPDGRFLAIDRKNLDTGMDIWLLPLSGNATPRPLIRTPHDERFGNFSPTDRLLAYGSDETGQEELFLATYPDLETKVQVSMGGALGWGHWGPDGTELFYRAGNSMMIVEVEAAPELKVGKPKFLFEIPPDIITGISLAPDGENFLMVRADEPPPSLQVNVVLNWFEELKELVPTGR